MFRGIPLLFLLCAVVAADPLLPFYREALATVGTAERVALEVRKGDLAVSGAERDRFSALSLDLNYGHTDTTLLKQPYQTTDILFSDTIDLFGRQRDAVEALRLASKGRIQQLNIQKQQLYTALADLVVSYRKAEALYRLHDGFYHRQSVVLEHLRSGVASGSVPSMDAGRFASALVMLEVQTVRERNSVDTMKTQLALYAPGVPVPAPAEQNLSVTEAAFMARSPQLHSAALQAKALAAMAEGTAKQWRPDVVAGAAYQFNNDPTANGDNYTFSAGVRMAFGGGIGDRAEAARVGALQADLDTTRQRVEVQQRFLSLRADYDTAVQVLTLLQTTVRSAEQQADTMQNAYLKHFVDFNTYLQTMQQLLSLKAQQIEARYRGIRSALLLNAFGKGAIYD